MTRLKDSADSKVISERQIPKNRSILSYQLIAFSSPIAHEKYPYPLRRIVVWDSKNQREIVLLTNHKALGSTTISAIYKDRWQIELFFKALKQNLKVNTFVATSENA